MPVARARRHVHLSAEERVARGKAARRVAPRSSHGTWRSPGDRPDPIALLEEQAESRVPELVPIRYGRMLVSPFTFFRGAALIMAADLAATPASGVNAQLCGDAHLSNFGVFGSPERQLIFDINDFDETLPGPWEWDVKRLAASFEILGRDRGFAPDDRRAIVRGRASREYRDRDAASSEHGGRSTSGTTTWTSDRSWTGFAPRSPRDESPRRRRSKRRRMSRRRGRATARGSSRNGPTRSTESCRIVADPPLVVPIDDLTLPGTTPDEAEKRIRSLVESYRQSLARPPPSHRGVRATSTAHARSWASAASAHAPGSISSSAETTRIRCSCSRRKPKPRCWSDSSARASTPSTAAESWSGQRLMQAASDIFLGWFRVKGIDGRLRDYYVRQLHDWKGGAEVERPARAGSDALRADCAEPRSHARTHAGATESRSRPTWAKATRSTGLSQTSPSAYADQNERDFEAFAAAVNSGRLAAQTGL